jgi:hypothetical protein
MNNRDRDTITVTAPTGFGSKSLGGRPVQYTITPKIGGSRGVTTSCGELVQGYLQIQGSTTIEGATFEGPDWEADDLVGSAAIFGKLKEAFSRIENWEDMVDDDDVNCDPDEDCKSSRLITTLKFTESIDFENVNGEIGWKLPNRVDNEGVKIKLEQASTFDALNKVFAYDVYLTPSEGKTWEDFLDDWTTYVEPATINTPSPGTTNPDAGKMNMTKVYLTLSNIGNGQSGSVFGIAYKKGKNVVIVDQISIDIGDFVVPAAP